MWLCNGFLAMAFLQWFRCNGFWFFRSSVKFFGSSFGSCKQSNHLSWQQAIPKNIVLSSKIYRQCKKDFWKMSMEKWIPVRMHLSNFSEQLFSWCYTSFRTKYLEPNKEIKEDWKRPEKFDICFCITFDRFSKSFTSGGETELSYASTQIWNFPEIS